MKITFLAADNCFSSGISGLVDTFTIANLWYQTISGKDNNIFTTEVVTIDGRPVTSSGCIQILADRSFETHADMDYVILPPFIPVPELGSPATSRILDWIIARHIESIPVAALCTGTFLLAETGLLDGRAATTNWQFSRQFRRRYPQVKLQPEKIYTEEDGLICTGAATASFNLGLKLIEKYGSKELASVCAKALLMDPNRTSQAPYFIEHREVRHTDEPIARAQRFMARNYAVISTIDEIACHISLSPRHFKRRFKEATGESPLLHLQNIRVESAKKMLESTSHSIDEITLRIGYENSSTFRRLFKKHTSLSPREYRDKFARRVSANSS